MVEIRVKLDDLDYANLIKVAFPIIKKKAQDETAMWATVVKHINEPDESSISTLLGLIPTSARDKLIELAFEKYKEEIPGVLTRLAESKGIKLSITDVNISIQ